jgi:hypothetical protein
MAVRTALTKDQRATEIARKIASAGILAELDRVSNGPEFADLEPDMREAVQAKVQQLVTWVQIGDLSQWIS